MPKTFTSDERFGKLISNFNSKAVTVINCFKIGEGRKAITVLFPILCSSSILPKNKRLIYIEIVQSIWLHCSETWIINLSLNKILLPTEMHFWRRSTRAPSLEKVKTLRIREIMDVKQDLVQTIEHNNLRLYGNVRRMKKKYASQKS